MSIVLPETLGAASMSALADALEREAQVWVLRGASEGVFCRGLDLETFDADLSVEGFSSLLTRLADGAVPSVALVEGAAQGGGLGVAAACDVVLATPNARFCLPEMLFGLVPGAIWPVLRRRVSEAALCRWAKTGLSFDAEEALRLGLADEVVETSEAQARLIVHRKALRRPSARAHARLQALCRASRPSSLADAIRRGAAETAVALSEADVLAARERFADGDVPWET